VTLVTVETELGADRLKNVKGTRRYQRPAGARAGGMVNEMATKTQVKGPEGLPTVVADLVVTVPAHKVDGWTVAECEALDISQPEVQELAYELLTSGLTVPQAMMGARGRAQNEDRKAKASLGGDGRWFASSAEVRKAAKAWRKANPELADWAKPRKAVAPVAEVPAEQAS
jgi:hypothetical protein